MNIRVMGFFFLQFPCCHLTALWTFQINSVATYGIQMGRCSMAYIPRNPQDMQSRAAAQLVAGSPGAKQSHQRVLELDGTFAIAAELYQTKRDVEL